MHAFTRRLTTVFIAGALAAGFSATPALARTVTGGVVVSAHRGGATGADANTLGAFKRSLAKGITDLEFDVRFTSDGVPVLAHDAQTKCAPAGIQKASAKAVLKCGNPTLADIFEFAKANPAARLRPELKSYSGQPKSMLAAQATQLARGVKNAGLASRVTIQSFDYSITAPAVHKVDRSVPVDALVRVADIAAANRARNAGAASLSYNAQRGNSRFLTAYVKHEGLRPIAWWSGTSPSKREVLVQRALGAKVMIADNPIAVQSYLKASPAWKSTWHNVKDTTVWTGTLKKGAWVYPSAYGKKVPRDAKLASITFRVTLPGKHSAGSLKVGPRGSHLSDSAVKKFTKRTKSVTLTSAPGNAGKLRVYSTSGKKITKARVKILGYSTVEPS